MKNKQTQNKELHILKFFPGIAWFFLILIAVCTPGYDLPTVGSWFTEISFDKLIHTGLFAVLAWLFMYPVIKSSLTRKEKWNWVIKITLSAGIYGLITELLQRFFIPSRSFDLFDLLFDVFGGLTALLYAKIRMPK
jgi:VanZ family protein